MMRLIVVTLIAAAVVGCATHPAIDTFKAVDASQKTQRSLLVGKWFGEATTKDGGKRLQITQRAPDGTYEVQFRITEKSGEAWDQSEVGFWGTSGSIYFTITKGWLDGEHFSPADPADASLNDAYQILELNQERFRYKALQSDNEYTLSRVVESFTFPSE